MKIVKTDENFLEFDNGSRIAGTHEADCCEYNYADFDTLDDIARNTEFTEPLDFEFVEDEGFRFGNKPLKMFFVPCYSEQNGYYSNEITILYNGKFVLSGSAEECCNE